MNPTDDNWTIPADKDPVKDIGPEFLAPVPIGRLIEADGWKTPRRKPRILRKRIALVTAASPFWLLVREKREDDAWRWLVNNDVAFADRGTLEDGLDNLILNNVEDRRRVRGICISALVRLMEPSTAIAPLSDGTPIENIARLRESTTSMRTQPPPTQEQFEEAVARCKAREEMWTRQADAAFRQRYPVAIAWDCPTERQFKTAKYLIGLEARARRFGRRQ